MLATEDVRARPWECLLAPWGVHRPRWFGGCFLRAGGACSIGEHCISLLMRRVSVHVKIVNDWPSPLFRSRRWRTNKKKWALTHFFAPGDRLRKRGNWVLNQVQIQSLMSLQGESTLSAHTQSARTLVLISFFLLRNISSVTSITYFVTLTRTSQCQDQCRLSARSMPT